MHSRTLTAAAILAIAAAAAPAAAKDYEIGYPKNSLAYRALVQNDLAKAETQLRRDARVSQDDPAKLINLGQVLAQTGRGAEAERMFQAAMSADEVDLILADGRTINSREAARRALYALHR